MSNFSIERNITVSSLSTDEIVFSNGTVITPSSASASQDPANIINLEDGQIDVADTSVTASSRIFVTKYGTKATTDTPGFLNVSSITPGVGYTVQSLDGNGNIRRFDNTAFFATIFDSNVVTGSDAFSSGEVTITEASATASSIIMVGRQGPVTGGEPGHIHVTSRGAGTFDIKSYDGDESIRTSDDSEIVWAVINGQFDSGEGTIDDGVLTVANPGISLNSKIQITRVGSVGNEPNHLLVAKIRADKNFTIHSREGSDGEANRSDDGDLMWVVIP